MFITKRKFSERAEALSKTMDYSYIDAVIHICKEENIDYYDIPSLLSTSLKSKIEAEALSKNLLLKKNTTAIIPI